MKVLICADHVHAEQFVAWLVKYGFEASISSDITSINGVSVGHDWPATFNLMQLLRNEFYVENDLVNRRGRGIGGDFALGSLALKTATVP